MTVSSNMAPRARRRAMRLSVVDGVLFALMVGSGEAFFVADMIRLGSTPLLQALVVTLPLCVGGLGPLLALRAQFRWRKRRPLVVTSAAVQSCVLLALALADLLGRASPALLLACVCLYQMCSLGGGALWSSWYGDVVPARIRGRYFSRRSRLMQAGTCVTLLTTGLVLNAMETQGAGPTGVAASPSYGFALVFAFAGLARLGSTLVLWASPEPPLAPGSHEAAFRPLLRDAAGPHLRRMLMIGFVLQMSVYVASPYFGPFMLGPLKLSYLAYTGASLAVVLAKIVVLPSWGRVIDSHKARNVYLLALTMVALIPLPWVWAKTVLGVVIAQSISGFAWGGYEVSHLSMLLDTAAPAFRARAFAANSFLNGVAQLLGSLLGGLILVGVGGDFRQLFAASAALRMLVALMAPRILRHVAPPGHGPHLILLRVIGFRPSGGLIHRIEAADPSGDTDNRPKS